MTVATGVTVTTGVVPVGGAAGPTPIGVVKIGIVDTGTVGAGVGTGVDVGAGAGVGAGVGGGITTGAGAGGGVAAEEPIQTNEALST